MNKPVLVSSSDGVGTKLKVAFMANKHDTVGIDLVAMSVNDIVVGGAKPLFFLDYLAMGILDTDVALDIVKGITKGCKQAGCSLVGGETAEMPGLYKKGEYDLAGFCVGIVDQNNIIDGSSIIAGNKIIGIASSGLHSNGYSLVNKILLDSLKPCRYLLECGRSLEDELLEPTKIYSKTILNLIKDFQIKGAAHITGGGMVENIPRILPAGLKAVVYKKSWEVPPIFDIIRKEGNISMEEMFRVFNNGIGMVLVVADRDVDDIITRLKDLEEKAFVIGEIKKIIREEGSIKFI